MAEGYTWTVERNWAGPGLPPDWQESGHQPQAFSADHAAEEWAYRYDGDGDYSIVGGNDVHVRVRLSDDAEGAPWEEFIVEGRTERAYYARKPRPPKTVPSTITSEGRE